METLRVDDVPEEKEEDMRQKMRERYAKTVSRVKKTGGVKKNT